MKIICTIAVVEKKQGMLLSVMELTWWNIYRFNTHYIYKVLVRKVAPIMKYEKDDKDKEWICSAQFWWKW